MDWRKHRRIGIIIALIFLQSIGLIQVYALDCSDVPPYDTPFACESYREIGQCSMAYVVLGGFCQKSCGRCQIQTQITPNQTSQQQQLPLDLLVEIVRVNTKGIHRREGFFSTQDCADRNFFQQFSCDGLKQWGQCDEKWLLDSGMCNLTCGFCNDQQAQSRQKMISQLLRQNGTAVESEDLDYNIPTNEINQDIDGTLSEEQQTYGSSNLAQTLEDLVPDWDHLYNSSQSLSPLPSAPQYSVQTQIPIPTATPAPALWIPLEGNVVISSIENTYSQSEGYQQNYARLMSRVQTEPVNVQNAENDGKQQLQSQTGVNVSLDEGGQSDSEEYSKPLCLFGNCISLQLWEVLGGGVENVSSISQQSIQSEIPELPQLKVQEGDYGNLQYVDGDIIYGEGPSQQDLAHLQQFVDQLRADLERMDDYNNIQNSSQYMVGDEYNVGGSQINSTNTEQIFGDEEILPPILEVVSPVPVTEQYVGRGAQCSSLLESISEATFYTQLLLSSPEILMMINGNGSNSSPMTLLVPDDLAFNYISEEVRLQMLNDRRLAESILQMSIIPEFLLRRDLVQGQRYDTSFKTGKLVETVKVVQVFPVVTLAGLINNVQIVKEDVVACNAVVHFINKVLRPSTLPL